MIKGHKHETPIMWRNDTYNIVCVVLKIRICDIREIICENVYT